MFVHGQSAGAIAMGVWGAALWEELRFSDDGRPLASTFKNYLVARSTDLPSITLDFLETPSPFTPLGVKAAGESGIGGALAAVVNAVNDALAPLGVEANSVPVDPVTVLDAIAAAEMGKAS